MVKKVTVKRQCTAHRKNGDRCKSSPIRGGTICTKHGGSAPQVQRKAQERLLAAADTMAAELLKIATDKKVPYPVRLTAIRDALDRAGVSRNIEISLGVKKWESIAEEILLDIETEPIPDDPDELPALPAASERLDLNPAYPHKTSWDERFDRRTGRER